MASKLHKRKPNTHGNTGAPMPTKLERLEAERLKLLREEAAIRGGALRRESRTQALATLEAKWKAHQAAVKRALEAQS